MEFCPHDGTALPPPNDTWDSLLEQAVSPQARLAPGTLLGQYKIVRILGEGGMATVYEAEHKLLGRKVAVKVLQKEMISYPEVVERFFQEARVVNQIRHPNIVDITDFGEATEETPPFMVMEFVEGKDLAHLIAEKGPMEPDFIRKVGKQVCDAMEAVHKAGVVHRDLKPDNIMLLAPDYEDIRLLDFGIVKFLATDKAFLRTATGQTLGTPEYMAPEQVRGKDLDARTDIYALGVILYEMATGQTPFEAFRLAEVFQNQLSKKPEPPSQVLERPFDPNLEHVILTCLKKDPAQRYQTMGELSEALGATAGPLSLSEASLPALTINNSHKGLWIGMLAFLLALAGATAWFFTRPRRDSDAENRAGAAATPDAGGGHLRAKDSRVLPDSGANRLDGAAPRDATVTAKVVVETRPRGAAIYDLATGRFLGTTPLTLPRANGRYQARISGYEPMEFPLSPETGDRLSLVLQKKKEPVVQSSRRHSGRRHSRRRSAGRRRQESRWSGHKVDEYGTVNPFKTK